MEPAGIVISVSVVAIALSADAIVTIVSELRVVGQPVEFCNSTANCLYTLLSARTCGGPSKILSCNAVELVKVVVSNVCCVEAYPCPNAVMSVVPESVVEVKFAIA